MAGSDDVRALLEKIPKLSYFQILGLPHKWQKPADVKKAFHAFAQLFHPDQFSSDEPELKEAAKEVFKRAVEAYEVLRDDDLQKRYVEKYLKKGKLRLPPTAFGKVDSSDMPKPKTVRPPKIETWVDEMKTEDGKEVAARIERMMQAGRFQAAFQQFGILEQLEPGNVAVKKKLAELKKRMG